MTQVRMTVRMPDELANDLTAIATKKGYSLNKLILAALWDYLEKQKEKGTHNEN